MSAAQVEGDGTVTNAGVSAGMAAINSTNLNSTPVSPFTWYTSLDLSYPPPAPLLHPAADLPLPSSSSSSSPPLLCFSCGAANPPQKCPQCLVAYYCNKDCYKADWKGGHHKLNCPTYKLLTGNGVFPDEEGKRKAVETGVVNRVRMYLCPIAVLNHSTKGPGFIYLQSPHTLEAFSFLGPGVRDTRGPIHPTRATSRTVILNYLTLGEFPNLTSSDFEVAQILPDLHRAATTMDCKTDVLVLVKFRCGYLGVLTVKIVLGYDACLALGQDYTGQESFQLNIDDI